MLFSNSYFALFHPPLVYGLVAWGSTFPTYLRSLKTLQNNSVKIIGGGQIRENPDPYNYKFNILKLNNLYKFEEAKIVHDSLNSNVPSSFSNFFMKSADVSNCLTRSSNCENTLYLPRYCTDRQQHSIKYQGVKYGIPFPLTFKNFPNILLRSG